MARHPLSKVLFHVGLASIFLFGLGMFVEWSLVLVAVFSSDPHPEHRLWLRRLLALAVLDTLLVAAFAGLLVPQVLKEPGALGQPQPAAQRRVLGIGLRGGPGGEVEIAHVVPGGPAQKAGLREGDRIVAVGGQPVGSVEEAQRRVGAVPEGQRVEVRISRDGAELLTSAVPVRQEELSPPARPLFEPEAPGECLPFQSNATVPWALLFAAAVVLGLYAAGRRHGMDATLLYAGGLLFLVSLLTQGAAVGTCLAVGGQSRGGVIASLYVQTLALLAGGAWLVRRVNRTQPLPGKHHRWTLTVGLGALYMLTGAIRIGAALLIVQRLRGAEAAPYGDSVLHQLAGSGLSWAAAVAFVVPVAVLGPIGEELLFRGVVLPWLARWMRPALAVAISAVIFGALHLVYGPFVLIVLFYGLVLGWARIDGGGLRAPIALHIAINGTASAVLLLTKAAGG